MRLRSKLDFIDAIILKFNTAWLKSNLNNIITSISVSSDNNSKTKLCRKITTEFSKPWKQFSLILKLTQHVIQTWDWRPLWYHCWENIWKKRFCISYKIMLQNIDRYSCKITCNIWILETKKNKKAYHDATKNKWRLNLGRLHSSLQFHNLPKMCGLSINSIRTCSRE